LGADGDARSVYAAEAAAIRDLPLRRFGRFSELEAYVESVVVGDWWDETFPAAPVELELQRRSRNATWSAACTTADEVGIMAIVDGHGWGLETVLHELAHLAAGHEAAHGPAFRRALGLLWRHEAGVEAWSVLNAHLEATGADS